MTQQPTHRPIRRGRIFPQQTIPPEELAKRQSELDVCERYFVGWRGNAKRERAAFLWFWVECDRTQISMLD